MKYFTTMFFFVLLIPVSAQFSFGLGLGNSNFRKIVPYSGSVHHLPVMPFAEALVGYRFKKQPIHLNLTSGFWVSQRIEESFNPPNWSRVYASYFRQQMHLASINYIWLEKKKIQLYTGINLGVYSLKPVFYTEQTQVATAVNAWENNKKRNFRAVFGAQSGIILGNKKLRTKIELRHAFFTQYEFAGFAQEMNTSLSIGVLWVIF